METNETFNQSAFYAAIKTFLVKKGYLSAAEAAAPDEWTLVQEASWKAYAQYKLSLTDTSIPWNWESVPLELLEDPDFVMEGAPESTVVPASISGLTNEPGLRSSEVTLSEPATDDGMSQALSEGSAIESAPQPTTFKVDTGEETVPSNPAPTTLTPPPAPSIDGGLQNTEEHDEDLDSEESDEADDTDTEEDKTK